ncbi:MAG TPA: UDP-glucose/GDP-mannose dehydrogenase family protein [Candidatus Nanoarchaeia archaeon]|nr:UDP-glucose/GDP-mannose dehydrogenase family protein [Candidatus Nanoarchaeia archaeon]
MKISIYGTGFVGLTTGACLANLGHEVICIDIDKDKINKLNQNIIPFYEPSLKELVELGKIKGRLKFTTDTTSGINSEIIFNCVGTPQMEDGSANLSYVFAVVNSLANLIIKPTIFINKSTVPAGTARKCQELFKDKLVKVVSNPEFLKEGNAVYDFMHPDKIVVGTSDQEAREVLRNVYSGLERPYLKILETEWETAEIIKYANNSFLATKISFINEIANICDALGGEIKTVAKALGMDYRISPKFLNAGLGYGGECFPKDVRALISTAREHGYSAKLLEEVHQVNERQKRVLVNKILKHYSEAATLAIWGLTFKPKTSDTREAVSLVMIRELSSAGFKLRVYDPIANEEVKKIFGDSIIYCQSAEEAAEGSDGIALVTEWDEFRGVNFSKLGETMKTKVLFDGRNIYEPSIIKKSGFTYYGVGRS